LNRALQDFNKQVSNFLQEPIMKRSFFIAALIIMVAACKSEAPKNKNYTLEELEKNQKNSLGIESIEKPDLVALNQKLSEAKKEDIEKMLQKKGLNFFEASYGFHYLGNRYFSENNFEKGLYYQQLSADEYLNPYAMLRLSMIYSKTKEEILADLPKGTKLNFKRDYEKSFRYLILALNTSILTMEYFEDRSVVDNINRFAAPLIEFYEKRDSSLLNEFDIVKAEEKAKKDLPTIKEGFLKVYKPKKKTEEKMPDPNAN